VHYSGLRMFEMEGEKGEWDRKRAEGSVSWKISIGVSTGAMGVTCYQPFAQNP
jgi:hypothetical protein